MHPDPDENDILSRRREARRLRALADHGPPARARPPAAESLLELAAQGCDAPIAMLTLVTAERVWITAGLGVDMPASFPIEEGICSHVVRAGAALEIPDLADDSRFARMPYVTGPPGLRFYHGHPVIDADGHALGAICVMDTRPRRLAGPQRDTLARLAQLACEMLDSRRQLLQAQRLAATIDQSDDEIYIVREPDLRVRYMNTRARASARVKGLDVPATWGFRLDEVVGWRDVDAVLRAMERLQAEGGRRADLETEDDFGGGVSRPVSLRLSRHEFEGDRAIVVRVSDLSVRRALEQALAESRGRWRFALECVGLSVIDWDLPSGKGTASVEALRLSGARHRLGHDAECGQVSREDWRRHVHPDDLGAVLAAVDAHLLGKAPDYRVAYRLVRFDRRTIHVVEHGRVVARDERGAPTRLVAVQRTASSAAAAAAGPTASAGLHAIGPTDARDAPSDPGMVLRQLWEGSGTPMVCVDVDGRVVHVNAAFCHLAGRPAAALTGRALVAGLGPRWRALADAFRTAREEGLGFETPLDLDADMPSGVPAMRLTLQVEPTRLAGEATAIVAALHPRAPVHGSPGAVDVSDLERLRRDNETLQRQLALITTSLSHDIRAPLQALHAFLRGSAAGGAAGERDDRLDVAREASERLEGLAARLIDYARGLRQPASGSGVEATAVFTAAWEALGSHRNTGAQLSIDPLPQVAADAALLRTVADNLLSNALKYARPGVPVRVEVRAETTACAGGETRIAVRDNGTGFPEQQAHRLFEPFQRLHPDVAVDGTGLGLASVKAIVERHGGRCGAFNNEDAPGATFWFTLPQLAPADDAGAARAAALRMAAKRAA